MKSYMRYWQSVIAVLMLSGLMLFPLTASAAGSVVYEQSPGHDGGFGSDGPMIIVADEFQLDQPTLIDTITWRGGYTSQATFPLIDNFTVQLFTDGGGQPGALLQSFAVGNNAARTPTGDFVNPPDPDNDFPGIPEFRYSFDLPTAFFAEANTHYWLSITNITNLPKGDGWLWEDSLSPLHPGVQRMFNNDGLWQPFPGNATFQLQGSPAPALTVEIDIKPGSFPNTINIRSRGKIPVAILSSPTFDAPGQVDQTSLQSSPTFGRTGDEQSLVRCSPEDVNGDGLLDLVCHFSTQATGFQLGDIKGVLKGRTVTGRSLIGTDSVRIVP